MNYLITQSAYFSYKKTKRTAKAATLKSIFEPTLKYTQRVPMIANADNMIIKLNMIYMGSYHFLSDDNNNNRKFI